MRKVILYSVLLIFGLIGSQFLPGALGKGYEAAAHGVKVLTMIGLAFIMIHVGYEFEIDKSRLKEYGWDYVVAATAAAFPWLFCALYFIFVLNPPESWASWDAWKEMLLASRFAAPTSAGILFSMLAAAGLGATWIFRKARTLAIFDDLDTVLLMIPLKMMIVGLRWELAVVVVVMLVQLWLAWRFLRIWRIPITWPWVMGYAVLVALASEVVYFITQLMDEVITVHIEVLLPAFVLGCMIARPEDHSEAHGHPPHSSHPIPAEILSEVRAATLVSACFMVLVGLSMPPILGAVGAAGQGSASNAAAAWPGWGWIVFHVLVITAISNLGKMFPVFCYRREAHWKERVALSVGMFPRGEVGAGVLIISLSYQIGGPVITVAMFSLALNLLCTGLFITAVKGLIGAIPRREALNAP